MHYRNTTFTYHNEFSEYMKVEGVTSEDVFDYLFDVGVGKFLSEQEQRYLYELFERWNLKHLQLNEDSNNYLDNDWLKDIIGDEGMQNLHMDD